MYVVGADFCLNNLHILPFAQFLQNPPHDFPFLVVENLPSEFRRKHDMVLAVPCGMGCRFISIIYFKSFDFIVMQLADRISILVKGFFHDRQKAFTELPA